MDPQEPPHTHLKHFTSLHSSRAANEKLRAQVAKMEGTYMTAEVQIAEAQATAEDQQRKWEGSQARTAELESSNKRQVWWGWGRGEGQVQEGLWEGGHAQDPPRVSNQLS